MIKQGLPELNLPPRLLSQMQKVVMPSTCSIVRKLLSDEDSYLMRSLRTPNNVILLHIRSYISHFKIPCHTLYISFQNTVPYPPSRCLVQWLVTWVLSNTRQSLRLPLIIIIIIIIITINISEGDARIFAPSEASGKPEWFGQPSLFLMLVRWPQLP